MLDATPSGGSAVPTKRVTGSADPFLLMRHGAWAGSVAGLLAETLMHPFDTISMRLKVQGARSTDCPSGATGPPRYSGLLGTARKMCAEEGIASLMGGVSATIYAAVPSNAIYFGTYELVKSVGLSHAQRHSQRGGDPADDSLFSRLPVALQADLVHFCAGITSEVAASVVVVPSEVVKSRMQLGGHPYAGALSGLVHIARMEGRAGVFAGYRACLSLDCLYSAVQFCLYERLRREIKGDKLFGNKDEHNGGSKVASRSGASTDVPTLAVSKAADLASLLTDVEDTAEDLVAGAVSGGLAAFISNPLDVASARLMTQTPASPASRRYKGAAHCLATIARTEGLRGLWAGSLARTISIAPLSAITFGVYEKIKAVLSLGT